MVANTSLNPCFQLINGQAVEVGDWVRGGRACDRGATMLFHSALRHNHHGSDTEIVARDMAWRARGKRGQAVKNDERSN